MIRVKGKEIFMINRPASGAQTTSGELKDFLGQHRRLLIISGAGVSTGSGIGDYRNLDGEWKRPQPVTHQAFMEQKAWRQRYWARSQLGFPSFMRARPNSAHRGLALLEQRGQAFALITQNVDGLHQRAGQRQVIDLHGRLDEVICMSCSASISREEVQGWLEEMNPHIQEQRFSVAPDGDADLELDFSTIQVPECSRCQGILKPNVVFYGASVAPSVVEKAYGWVEASDALLVVGTSLMVYSSFRFVRMAHRLGKPIIALNRGKTRADGLYHLKLEMDCSQALDALLG